MKLIGIHLDRKQKKVIRNQNTDPPRLLFRPLKWNIVGAICYRIAITINFRGSFFSLQCVKSVIKIITGLFNVEF